MADPYMISTAVLSVIIIEIGIAFLMKTRISSLTTLETGGIREFCYTMVLFIPHILIVFGFIADALSQDFRYSVPSITGFLSIFFNWGLGLILRKFMGTMSAPPPLVGGAETGCFIPGFDSFTSEFTSAPIVVTSTIMFYYVIDLLQNRGFYQSGATIIAMIAFIASQFWILKNNGCFAGFSSVGAALSSSVLVGLLFGGSAYGLIWGVWPDGLPSKVYAPGSAGSNPAPTAPSTTPGCPGGRCGAPADDDQFVCDSYINGMPATR
jgi:hypothetical protein